MSVPRASSPGESPLPPAPATAARSWRGPAALAAALYLAVALWALRPILPHPASTLPYPTALHDLKGTWLDLSLNDELLTATVTARNARHFLTAPWALFDNGTCYPLEKPTALGEHMFGLGLLGTLPYLASRDPVLTLNAVLVAKLWLAAMAMFVAVAYWTGSAEAALVAGLLFAFQPTRLGNLIHAYVESNEWTVIALLAAHRLFSRGTWTAAAALAAALVLQSLESFYPLIGLTILGGTYGAYLAVRYRRRLLALAPKLAAVVLVVGVVVAAVLGPYMRLKDTWGTLGGRTPLLYELGEFGWGGRAYPGTVVAVLVAVALLDRLRRRRDRRGYDPRLPYLAGALLVLAFSVYRLPLPFGASLPSLYTLAAAVVPGLDAIRGAAAVSRGATLALTFLAGWGMLVLVERRTPARRAAIATAAAALALAEVFVPALAARSFGAAVTMAAHPVRPAAELLALYDRLPPGPVLDAPYSFDGRGVLFEMPHYVFLGAYHGHPVGACYNSFIVQAQHDLETLVSRIPEPRAMDALAALGFGSLVIHDELLGRAHRALARLAGPAADGAAVPRAAPVAHVAAHTLYVFDRDVPATTSFAALAASGPSPSLVTARPPSAKVNLVFRNGAAETYRHPLPVAPTPLVLRWYDAGGVLVREERRAELLPLALGAGDSMLRALTVPIAVAPGEYELTLAPAATPEVVVARQRLRVVAAGTPG